MKLPTRPLPWYAQYPVHAVYPVLAGKHPHFFHLIPAAIQPATTADGTGNFLPLFYPIFLPFQRPVFSEQYTELPAELFADDCRDSDSRYQVFT